MNSPRPSIPSRGRIGAGLELKLQQDIARPILYQQLSTACRQPYVKGYVQSFNGIYTHNRLEDVWLDK